MKQFFKIFFASALGFFFAALLLGVVLVLSILGLVSSLENDKEVEIHEKTILHFKPGAGIAERGRNDFANFDFSTLELRSEQGLDQILSTLESASSDDRVAGLYLELPTTFAAGYSTILEIRQALERFSDSGKFIIAYANVLTEWGYYLASAADKVWISPTGTVLFNGLYADVWFYRAALEKLGVKVQVFKHGTFKSAVEPYIMDEMSPENRLQVEKYVNSLFNTYIADISESRELNPDSVRQISDKMLIRRPEDAKNLGMIDELGYEDAVFTWLRDQLKVEEDKDLEFLSMSDYASGNPPKLNASAKDQIAILYATGVIQDDGSGDEVMSATEMIKALREIRKNKKIKALVLRINSPGGSALASDLIYRELELIREKMPIIVSMGDVAASGGYYIAALADTIIAQPNTITGSIGVFALIPDMQGLLNTKLGIHTDGVKTGEYSDLGRIDRPMTEGEKAIFQQLVEDTYADFTRIVSRHRDIPQSALDSIAEGRVWTGLDARDRGLVDLIGGIRLAFSVAAEKASIDTYRVVSYPKQEDPFGRFLRMGKKEAGMELLREELGEQYQVFVRYRQAMQMKGVQMRLPYDIVVE